MLSPVRQCNISLQANLSKKQRNPHRSIPLNSLTLVINSGSSSVKFGLFYRLNSGSSIEIFCRGSLDGVGSEPSFNIDALQSQDIARNVIESAKDLYFSTVEQAHQVLAQWLNTFIPPSHITAVCYRVVHGGDFYTQPVLINKQVIQNLESLIPFAPLHQKLGLSAINVFMKCYPIALHKACFDTAFHRSMPKVAQTFAIPRELTAKGIKPYGFHGLSYEYIASKLAELNQGNLPNRVIVAHLGSGASMCALKDGHSIATTMTFSPLDGLPMATRCGSIDASAVFYMVSELKISISEVSSLLNKKSGLLGVSGISGDIRTLLDSKSADAEFTMDFFIHRICRELGALAGLLRGLDTLVFTGGAGAYSWQIREKVCEQFSWLGVSVNPAANKLNEFLSSGSESKIQVFVLKTDEEMTMAKQVMMFN